MITAKQLGIAARIASESPVPLDRLPYTEEFESVYERFQSLVAGPCSRHQFWWALFGARKRGMVGASRRRRRGPKSQRPQPDLERNKE